MTHFDPADPRMTAFALGELTGDERTEFETHVASCPECARLIDELRQVGQLVAAGFRAEGEAPEKLATLPVQVAQREPAKRWNRRRVLAYATAASMLGLVSTLVYNAHTERYAPNRIETVLISSRQHSTPVTDKVTNVAMTAAKDGSKTSMGIGVNYSEAKKVGGEVPEHFRKHTLRNEMEVEAERPRREAATAPDATKASAKEAGASAAQTSGGLLLGNQPAADKASKAADAPRFQSVSPIIERPIAPMTAPPAGNLPTSTAPQQAAYGTNRDTAGGKPTDSYDFRVKSAPRQLAELEKLSDADRAAIASRESLVPPRSELRGNDAENRFGGQQHNTEAYARIHDNPFLAAKSNPLSTFSIDVDTGAYSNVRRFLTSGQLPPPDAVRIEELLNYFSYDYAPPKNEHPFAAHVEVASAPWMPAHRLVRVGIKGKVVTREQRPAANLVFLVDVSGSMSSANKLPLVKQALKLLVEQLDEKDRVALAVYAGASGLVLDTTPAYQKEAILTAIDRLQSGGSTNGGAGIQLAYSIATKAFIKEGVNRVILATDGDFNVGVTNQGELTRLIEEKAKTGVFLSVLGFGMGNLKDATLEQLADKGNGTYGYIDTLAEARKVFVEQVNGTLVTIAKDVKIQIEFNPAQVAAYRLIGYENRILAKEDFNDDTKDAGEIGAGHTMTALYEVVPVGVNSPITTPKPAVDPLKYQSPGKDAPATEPAPPAETKPNALDELLTLKLRYKQPDGDKSTLIETAVKDTKQAFEQAGNDLRFAASVAAFGMKLRKSPHAGDISWQQIVEFARQSAGEDPNGYRHEFVTLVEQAAKLSGK